MPVHLRTKNQYSILRLLLKLMFVVVYFPRSLPDPIIDFDGSFIRSPQYSNDTTYLFINRRYARWQSMIVRYYWY
jgi:hypothetical protein